MHERNAAGASPMAKDLVFAEEEEPLDVLDLPQLYSKPSAESLLSILSDLSSAPASWEATPRSGTPRSPLSGASTPYRKKREIRNEGVPSYLTNIISSPLTWIEDETMQERIWKAASLRLSERSGRTAMGAISRSFIIPLDTAQDHSNGHKVSNCEDPKEGAISDGYLELTLHEPALTGDDLGLKTWASSFLLAKRLPLLRTVLPPLDRDAMVLELGSGTGLVGLAAAAVLQRHVILTDLPEIVPNLERNSKANASTLSQYVARVDTAVLDWMHPGSFFVDGCHDGRPQSFPLILAADPIYSSEHPRMLVQAVKYHLSQSLDARVVVEMPLRDAYLAEREDFRAQMTATGLTLLSDGEETGFDDWSGNDEEPLEVRCWWSIWGRR